MTPDMPIDDALKQALRERVAGGVLGPDDEGFDEARQVWNARFDRRPALIVTCADASDVVAAVNCARDNDLLLSVKGGGHDYAGNTVGEGCLLIDLGRMRDVHVDAAGRRATVGAGATWGEFDRAAQEHGLATPGGSVSTVGVAGFTLGGGEGWLSRKHGVAADNLLSVDVVTAAGDLIRASEEENPDLFWALRGGGGNFGVVTSFEYALHEVGPEVLAGQVIYPADRAAELLRFYRDYSRTAPDEVGYYAFFLRIPPIPDFPEALHGRLVIDFVVSYAGDLGEGEEVLAPFRSHGDAIADTIAPMSYLDLQQSFDAGMAKGSRWYTRAQHIDDFTDARIDALVDNLEPFPGEFTTAYLGAMGGAIARKSTDAIAYPHRGGGHELHVFPGWVAADRDEEIMTWARRLHDAVASGARRSVYVNLLAEDERDRVRDAYTANYERLLELKRRWDPTNLFRMNHNIDATG